MKKIKNFWIITILLLLSLGVYSTQILLFRNVKSTIFYFLQDLGFFVLEFTILYFILEKILDQREKMEKIKKLDVVISAYFFESGTTILHSLSKFDKELDVTKAMLDIDNTWSDSHFKSVIFKLKKKAYSIDSLSSDLEELKIKLLEQKNHMLMMLQNPSLLEHDYFTDMLWAIFHLLDELTSRERLINLPKADTDHLSGDIKRAYRAMLVEWVYYSKHLKHTYPYLFSLAERKKPFYDNSVIFND